MPAPDRTTPDRETRVLRDHRRRPAARRHASVLAPTLLILTLAAAMPGDARANDHDARRGAHPARIAAYLLHPVGVALDWLIVRPAHWVVEREPFRTIFGHEPR